MEPSAAISSMPGGVNWTSSRIASRSNFICSPEVDDRESNRLSIHDWYRCFRSSNHFDGSISIPERLLMAATLFLSGPIFSPKLSEREWAGSVEKIRIFLVLSDLARASAKAAAAVVLPTPPLPPKINTFLGANEKL